MIADAHLDLAYNATRGRNPRMPAKDQPVVRGDCEEVATVGLPDLHAGGVGLICGTLFCSPGSSGDRNGYSTADEARVQALDQLAWYRRCVNEGLMEIVRARDQLLLRGEGVSPSHSRPEPPLTVPLARRTRGRDALATILLMEGADAMRSPADVGEWFDAGVRIVGLAWRKTRMAGGTGAPGPITEEGRAIVRELDRVGIIHDTSHLAEESFFQLLELTPTSAVMASHSNCRAIVGEGDRHLSDEMIRALLARGGVIGINLYDQFLLPVREYGKRRASLNDVVAHVRHVCDLAGDTKHVAIGTDMDGGFGREQIPVEIETAADLPRIGEALSNAGFGDEDVGAIMGGNWLRFFHRHLPV